MLVKNPFYNYAVALGLCFSLFLFYQCNPSTCNLSAPSLSTSNISANAAKVSWGSLNTTSADDYQVELLDANTNNVISSTFTANTEYTFTNLVAQKTYLVRVTPRCDVNTASNNQSSINFTTLSAALVCNLPAPTLLKIVPLSSSTASLLWEPVQTAISYQITVFDSTANTTRILNISPPPTITLDSLVAGHKYSIKVAARCPNGEVSLNGITRDYVPFIIEDDILMFNSKIIADNCNLDDPIIPISNGHYENYAPLKIYGGMPDSGSSFLVNATNGAESTDIRVVYGKFGNKIIISAGLNCTKYELPSRTGNIITKAIGTGSLQVVLYYNHFEVFYSGSGVTATLNRLP
jgi:hypothetical protein